MIYITFDRYTSILGRPTHHHGLLLSGWRCHCQSHDDCAAGQTCYEVQGYNYYQYS